MCQCACLGWGDWLRGGGVGGSYQPGVSVPLKALFLVFSHTKAHYFQMTQNGTEEIDEATLLQDPDYKALVDYGINKVVAAELKKIYESGQSSYSI